MPFQDSFFVAAMNALPAHIAVLDEEGTIQYVNDQWKVFAMSNGSDGRAIGVGANYLRVSRISKECGCEEAGEVYSAIQRLIAGEASSCRINYPCHNPEFNRWFQMTATRLVHEGHVYVVIMHEDVTAQMIAEERLRSINATLEKDLVARKFVENELREASAYLNSYRTVVDQHAIVCELDLNQRLMYVNQQFCDRTGIVFENLIGKGFETFFSNANGNLDFQQVMRHVQSHGHWHGELCCVPEKSTHSWLDTTIAPLFTKNGRVRGYFVLQIDISELKKAQAQAESASRAKSVFLANVCHEIRTPMTAIMGFAQLLQQQSEPCDAQQRSEYCDTIHRNGEHLLAIINDILDLSKIEADKLELETIAIDPNQIAQEVYRTMNARAQAKGLQLLAMSSSEVPRRIMSDPLRLKQVLLNLVSNAIKFTEEGTVKICVDVATDADHLIAFEVSDTGMGIQQEHLSRLFGSFEQADASTTRRFGGSGLGLQISKKLSKMLGGDLHADSTFGKGSTFRLTLDLRKSPQEHSTFAAPTHRKQFSTVDVTPSERPLADLHILLVEDGADNQRLIKHFLNSGGAIVTIAEHGQQAIEMLTSDHTLDGPLHTEIPFDIILTDIQMPILDGYSTVKLLREKGLQLPIVALTAYAMSNDFKACIDAGCNHYLSKPIDRQQLVKVCRELAVNHVLRA